MSLNEALRNREGRSRSRSGCGRSEKNWSQAVAPVL